MKRHGITYLWVGVISSTTQPRLALRLTMTSARRRAVKHIAQITLATLSMTVTQLPFKRLQVQRSLLLGSLFLLFQIAKVVVLGGVLVAFFEGGGGRTGVFSLYASAVLAD